MNSEDPKFLNPVQDSIPLIPGRRTAADPEEQTPETFGDLGIHNRKMARQVGIVTRRMRHRKMSVPK